ncbi:protein SRG1-like [Telopea speciosissima]|uniref:protein SRG1-like n=1 Tax=Telopea speciosissima TaxID=54955 RepID=UPI001CC39CDF|nr:protein SRG1-like [Telopea speciosissima]
MATKQLTLGSSLPVPNVQELVKEPMNSIPTRFIRPDQEPPIISSDAASLLPAVPVIDLQKLQLSGESMDAAQRAKLHSACQEWGFFQVVNHGVSSSLVEKLKIEIQEFFKLPIEEKKKFWQLPGDVEGFGNQFVISEEQKLDWADMFFMRTLPTYTRVPHLFPNLPLPLRETLDSYALEMKKLAMTLLEEMAKALKMDAIEMRELFEEGMQCMRMNYYPPCPQPEKVIGISPHSDISGLTILLQVNEIEGLQIRKDGIWVPVTPLPHAFVVNIGDTMEILSNGTYHSIEHRATVNSVKERLSIGTFYSPKLDGEVGPVRSLITRDRPALFRTVGAEEFSKSFLTVKLEGKSYVEFMRIPNGEGSVN